VETFQDLEAGRRELLERENALMADLPKLKALMTTNDREPLRMMRWNSGRPAATTYLPWQMGMERFRPHLPGASLRPMYEP